jgi:hypothetical protein
LGEPPGPGLLQSLQSPTSPYRSDRDHGLGEELVLNPFAKKYLGIICQKKGRQRAIRQCPLDAALDRLMMYPKSLSHGKKRPLLAIGEQHLRPLHVARRLGPRPRKSRQCFNLLSGHRQVDRSPPPCHDAAPRSPNCKRGIHQQISRSWNRSSSLGLCKCPVLRLWGQQ